MPLRGRICPTCRFTAAPDDTYCSSCGAVLPSIESTSDRITPLLVSGASRPADLHPLHIVPDTTKQRRRLLRRGAALLATMAIACLFAIALILAADRPDDVPVRVLVIASGLLTIVAIGGWINFGVRRTRKRARRQQWQMSTF